MVVIIDKEIEREGFIPTTYSFTSVPRRGKGDSWIRVDT